MCQKKEMNDTEKHTVTQCDPTKKLTTQKATKRKGCQGEGEEREREGRE